jgi:hypothetical protein
MPYVRPNRRMRFPRGMGDVLCADGATADVAGDCFDVNTGDVIGSVPLPAPVVYTPTPATTPAASSPSSSLDSLFANLAIGGENILGKVVAPAYQQVCTASGCTTTIAGSGGAATTAGLPGLPGSLSSSSLLLIGGVALLAVLFMGMGKK